MRGPVLAFCLGMVVLCLTSATATTVVPPTLDELVSRSAAIFDGTVRARRSTWETSADGRTIITTVTFTVRDVLKGTVPAITELTFLGGTVGDMTLRVAEMPTFEVGDRDLLFVGGEQNAACPLVGFGYGRMRVVRNVANGADEVRTHNDWPFFSDTGTRPLLLPVTPAGRPPLSAVTAQLRQRVAALRGR